MNLRMLFTDPMVFLLQMLYLLPAILIGLSFHEAAHAYAANKMGDPTAKNLGRLTLDPVKHLDPLGFICLLFLGFGWAKPVPVNPNNFKNRRKGEFFVSIAGVTMNFILGVAFTFVLALMYVFGLRNNIAETIISYIISINFMLMVFNFLPIGPLDGTGIFRSIFWRNAYKFDAFMDRYGLIILIVLLFSGIIGTVIGAVSGFIELNVFRLVSAIFGI